MADKTYEITFHLSDGTKKPVRFVAPQGEKGDSVKVEMITYDPYPGGENILHFNDGSRLSVFNGPMGPMGARGNDGFTPVKGIDYFKPEEIEEIISETVIISPGGTKYKLTVTDDGTLGTELL